MNMQRIYKEKNNGLDKQGKSSQKHSQTTTRAKENNNIKGTAQ